MRTRVVFPLRALFGLALAIGWLSAPASGDDGPQRWVTTWTTANAASDRGAVRSVQAVALRRPALPQRVALLEPRVL